MTNNIKLLLSNDDGVYAPGLKLMRQKLAESFHTVTVAPLEERSTTGHRLSLDVPLRLKEIEKNVYGCSGFPADCAMIGLHHVLKDELPNLMVSGVNRGGNLGQDVYYSGTIAAAREAVFHHIPAIAISLEINFQDTVEDLGIFYETAIGFVNNLIGEGIHEVIPSMTVLNINVPNVPFRLVKGIRFTHLGKRIYTDFVQERMDCRNRKYYWIGGNIQGYSGDDGNDCKAVDEKYISVSTLPVYNEKIDHTALLDFLGSLKTIQLPFEIGENQLS